MKEQEELLRQIGETSFATDDIRLFLDTHPFHAEALGAFRHYCRSAEVLKKEYDTKYGPLSACANCSNNEWQWVEGPWPWEI